MIKLVAFDFNGTLIADTWPVLQGVNLVLKHFDKKPISHKEFLEHYDVPVSIAYKNHGLDPDTIENSHGEISKVFHTYYESQENKIRTRANARRVLKYLHGKKIINIIFSNHTQDGVSKQLTRLRLKPYIEKLLANSAKHHALVRRAKQERLEQYIKENKINTQEILIVGDSIEEIQIAKSMHALVCSITHGNCSTKRLKAAKPDYLISDLGQLINIVRKLDS